jgi:hypothetical protein
VELQYEGPIVFVDDAFEKAGWQAEGGFQSAHDREQAGEGFAVDEWVRGRRERCRLILSSHCSDRM